MCSDAVVHFLGSGVAAGPPSWRRPTWTATARRTCGCSGASECLFTFPCETSPFLPALGAAPSSLCQLALAVQPSMLAIARHLQRWAWARSLHGTRLPAHQGRSCPAGLALLTWASVACMRCQQAESSPNRAQAVGVFKQLLDPRLASEPGPPAPHQPNPSHPVHTGRSRCTLTACATCCSCGALPPSISTATSCTRPTNGASLLPSTEARRSGHSLQTPGAA